MSSHSATANTVGVIDRGATTGGTIDEGYLVPRSDQVAFQNRYVQFAARRAFQNAMAAAIRLDPPYRLNISPVTAWLPSVERRIKDSIAPREYEGLGSTEWLREEVGQAAIHFFQNAADFLPGEPFLYASQTGALVAEFKGPRGALTIVISSDAVILFAVKADETDAPVQMTLKRSSTRLREDLKQIVHALSGSHGQMGTAR